MKKLLIILIISLILLNGCGLTGKSLIGKQKCIQSSGEWHSGSIGPGGGSDGWCDCSGIGGKTTEDNIKCVSIKEVGLICCKDTRRIPAGDYSVYYEPLKKELCVGDYMDIVEDNLC